MEPVGAGDAFAAGLLAGVVRGDPVAQVPAPRAPHRGRGAHRARRLGPAAPPRGCSTSPSRTGRGSPSSAGGLRRSGHRGGGPMSQSLGKALQILGPARCRPGHPGPARGRAGGAQDHRAAPAAHARRRPLRLPRRQPPLPPRCPHPRAVLARPGPAGGPRDRRAAPARVQPGARAHHAPVRARGQRGGLHRQARVPRPRPDGLADRAAGARSTPPPPARSCSPTSRRPSWTRCWPESTFAARHPRHHHRPRGLPRRAGDRPRAGLGARPGGERGVDQLHRRAGVRRVGTAGGRRVGLRPGHRPELRPAPRPAARAAGRHRAASPGTAAGSPAPLPSRGRPA